MECLYFHRKLQLLLSVYVDEIEMDRKILNMQKMWATLQKNVDLDDPVPFTDQKNLGCTQWTAQVNNIIVMERHKLFSKLTSTSAGVQTEEKKQKDITA